MQPVTKILASSQIQHTFKGWETLVLDFAQKAKNSITNATNRTAITAIKDSAITELDTLVKAHKSALGELGEEKAGTAVKVTKGDTEVILYAPDKVEYIIRK